MTLMNEPINRTDIKNKKKYCRFKKNGIKYIDYKDANFLLKFVNDQGKILPRRLTGTSLKYQKKVLTNAQEGKTKAMRQWRFSSETEMDEKLILEYIEEAIQNQKDGKIVKADKKKPLVIPKELAQCFSENAEFLF